MKSYLTLLLKKISSQNKDTVKVNIDKSIRPETNLKITPFSISVNSVGYEVRQDNVKFILEEYKKAEYENKKMNK